MNEVDEHGWAHIHQAAKKGYFKSVEKFIKASDDQLEFETQDDLRETPLLVSVRAGMGNLDTINIIVDLGGNLTAINNLNHGIVEICCMEGHTGVLEHFIKLNRPELPVWPRLLKFCTSELEDEAEHAGKSLSVLLTPNNGEINPNWKYVYEADGVKTLVKVIKSQVGDRAKEQMLQCLINILQLQLIKEQVVSSGGIESLIAHLRSSDNTIVRLSAKTISILCSVRVYAEQAALKGAIGALVNVISNNTDSEVLVAATEALGVLCEGSETRQTLLYHTTGGMQSICHILKTFYEPSLLLSICNCVSKICRRHENNQNSFVQCKGIGHIVMLTDIKHKDIQLAAVDTIHMVVEGNPYVQKTFREEGVVNPLINLLNKGKNRTIQEKTAGALWALAGEDGEERRAMAATMGVNLLIDFLGSLSEILHFIGSEGLGVLAQGAHNKQDAIAEANGVYPLVRLLKCDKEYLVLSAIRSIRHLCAGVGYLPHPVNQKTVAQARGIKLLTALLVLSKNELIKVEAALTLACVALGNADLMKELWNSDQHLEFNYVRVLKLLYSDDNIVRLLAGAAIATFAYNNMNQQGIMAQEGGVRFSCFMEFLQSEDEYLRCNAAFQVVVLARIIPDEEQAVASAAGIKLIADILNESSSDVILALAADCIARLAHTRAGIPQAFIAIGSVERLCSLMYSTNSQVRGCSAIALAYLSYNHLAERQLLNKCRGDPYLMKCLRYYTEKHKLSNSFNKEWNHYKKVGSLPKIQEGRPSLVSQQNHRMMITAKMQQAQNRTASKADLPIIVSPSYNSAHSSMQDLHATSVSRASKISYKTDSVGEQKLSERSISVE